jgi:2-succinyl-6-hydroxy-2,4-cyclohexadiene-1-carboxylate synthase
VKPDTVGRDPDRYHFIEKGMGSPVMLLHGFTGSTSAMHDIVEVMSSRHRVVAVDLIGHGNSPKPISAEPYALDRVLAGLDRVISDLDLEPLHLVGYSMGGRIALAYAVGYRHRLRSLVLLGASAGIGDSEDRSSRRRSDEALADRIEQNGIAWFVDAWMSQPILRPTLSRRAVAGGERSQRMENVPHALANVLRQLGTGVIPPLHAALTDLDLPVAVMAGEADEKFRDIATGLVGALPRATAHVIPDAGHAAHLDNLDGVAGAVLGFLRDVDDQLAL